MATMRTLLYTLIYAYLAASSTSAASLQARSGQEGSLAPKDVGSTVDGTQDQTAFSRLLGAVSPRGLHQILHDHVPRAVGEIHAGGVKQGSGIARVAIRQASSSPNDTATSESDSATSDTPTPSDEPTTTPDTPSMTSADEPATSTEEPTPTESTETPGDTTTSEPPSVTTTTDATPTSSPDQASESTESTKDTKPTETPKPTPSHSPSSESSSSPTSESSNNDDDSLTTSTRPSITHSPTSKTSTFTSTLPGGVVTTVTEVAVITPDTPGDDESAPTSAIGNLHTGLAARAQGGRVFEKLISILVGIIVLV